MTISSFSDVRLETRSTWLGPALGTIIVLQVTILMLLFTFLRGMLADAWGRMIQFLEYVNVVHLVSPRPDALFEWCAR